MNSETPTDLDRLEADARKRYGEKFCGWHLGRFFVDGVCSKRLARKVFGPPAEQPRPPAESEVRS
jgi:hypothetical protein